MMELRDYLKGLPPEQHAIFAVRVGTTLAHLRNVAYKTRIASAALAAQIEIESGGRVPVAVLRPADAHLIWDQRRNQLVVEVAIVGQIGVEPIASTAGGLEKLPCLGSG